MRLSNKLSRQPLRFRLRIGIDRLAAASRRPPKRAGHRDRISKKLRSLECCVSRGQPTQAESSHYCLCRIARDVVLPMHPRQKLRLQKLHKLRVTTELTVPRIARAVSNEHRDHWWNLVCSDQVVENRWSRQRRRRCLLVKVPECVE